MGSWVKFRGRWRYRAGHRSQRPVYDPRVLRDPRRSENCTVYAGLEWLDQETESALGPGISGQSFRARQSDDEGGIGIDDLQEALRNTPGAPTGLMLDVVPGPTSIGGQISVDDLWRLSRDGRPIVWQGDYDALIAAGQSCLSGFRDPHAIVTLGQHLADDRVLGSDPLCGGSRWYSKATLRAFTGMLPTGRVLLGSPGPEYPAKVTYGPGWIWRYKLNDDGTIAGRERVYTTGFWAFCTVRVSRRWAGRTVYSQTVTILAGGSRGRVLNGDGFNVRFDPA